MRGLPGARLDSASCWHLWPLQGSPWGSQGSAPQLRGDPEEDTGEVCQGPGAPAGLPSALRQSIPLVQGWQELAASGGLPGLGPQLRGDPVKETREVCQGHAELLSGNRRQLGGLHGWQDVGASGGSPGSVSQPMEDSMEETGEVCQGPGRLDSASCQHLWQLRGSPWGSQGSAPQLGVGGTLPRMWGRSARAPQCPGVWPMPPTSGSEGCRVARSRGPWVNPGKIPGQPLAGSVLRLMFPAQDGPRDPQAWGQLQNSRGPWESPRGLLLMPGATLCNTWGNSARDRWCPKDRVLTPTGVWEACWAMSSWGPRRTPRGEGLNDPTRGGLEGLGDDRTNIWYLVVKPGDSKDTTWDEADVEPLASCGDCPMLSPQGSGKSQEGTGGGTAEVLSLGVEGNCPCGTPAEASPLQPERPGVPGPSCGQ